MSDTSVTNSLLGARHAVRYHEPMATVEHPTDDPDLAHARRRGEDQGAAWPRSRTPSTLVLRVAIQGGGCSGFQYGLGFDAGAAEGDVELSLEGVPVVVDPFSAPYLQGATIDFLNTISGVRASRSTTRTPSPRAAAATPSRWTRAKSCPRAPRSAAAARLLALTRFSRLSLLRSS